MSLPDGNSPLHIAVINNRLDEIRRLVKLPETERDLLNHHGETPLFLSLQRGCSDHVVSELIDCGCNVNVANEGGLTPLHVAVKRSNPLILSKLMENGADTNAKDKGDNCTPLHEAIRARRLSSIQEILRLDKELHITPALLSYSLEKGCNDKIVSLLIDHYSDSIAIKPLFLALDRATTYVFEKLILHGGNIDAKTGCGLTLLHHAIEIGSLERICMLLFYNVSVNERDTRGRSPFERAILTHSYVIARQLIDYVDDFNCDSYEGFTALHLAIRHCPEIAIEIIEKGGDVNVPWRDTHCIVLCLKWHEFSAVFEAIWPRIDFEILSTVQDITKFFETFVTSCKFADDEFLKCLYMVLGSSHVEEFFNRTEFTDRRRSLLITILERDLSEEDRIEVIALLLSYGVEVFFNDISSLYEMYGFDAGVEMLLTSGCCIYRNNTDNAYLNPIASKICYNNFDIYTKETVDTTFNSEHYLTSYGQFYKVVYSNAFMLLLMKEEPELYNTDKVKSLVQLSRDVVRHAIYTSQSTDYYFKAYQAFSQLPVPLEIRDILFLKRAIY